MSGRIVREGPHRCEPGYADNDGTIWQCECGRYWIARRYPNLEHDHWRPLTWFGRKLRGLP